MVLEILKKGASLEHAEKALIALHGRGGTSQDIMQIAQQITDKTYALFAPQALNQIWYPARFMMDLELNQPYLTRSLEEVDALIEQIQEHLPLEKVYLMGFSQGACLSLEYAARHARSYGGIIAFIGGLIGKEMETDKYVGHLEGTPIFIGSRDQDPFIPAERCADSAILLQKMGAHVTLQERPGDAHKIESPELIWVKRHITKVGA